MYPEPQAFGAVVGRWKRGDFHVRHLDALLVDDGEGVPLPQNTGVQKLLKRSPGGKDRHPVPPGQHPQPRHVIAVLVGDADGPDAAGIDLPLPQGGFDPSRAHPGIHQDPARGGTYVAAVAAAAAE